MSLQSPIIVVADTPAPDIVEALDTAGAFPIVETNWADAPTAFVAVKPAAVVIAESGAPRSDAAARTLSLQIVTAPGPMVPTLAVVQGEQGAAIPVALCVDAGLPLEQLIVRLRSALRVRELHATVLRRIETVAAPGGKLPALPADDATVLVAGRGPLYPALGVAIAERVNMVGSLSVETAAKHLASREINGIVVGDGFSPRVVEAFLTLLAQDTRFRDIPIAVIGEAPPDLAGSLPNIDQVDGSDPERVVARLVPPVRLHAFEARLKRMLKSLDAACSSATRSGASLPRRSRRRGSAASRCPSRGLPSGGA